MQESVHNNLTGWERLLVISKNLYQCCWEWRRCLINSVDVFPNHFQIYRYEVWNRCFCSIVSFTSDGTFFFRLSLFEALSTFGIRFETSCFRFSLFETVSTAICFEAFCFRSSLFGTVSPIIRYEICCFRISLSNCNFSHSLSSFCLS